LTSVRTGVPIENPTARSNLGPPDPSRQIPR
jgi:hypothetical protein